MSPMGRGSGKTPENVVQLVAEEVLRVGQNATARAIGIPLRSVQKYLAGTSEPTQASLEKLAVYFGVSVEYLRGQTMPRDIFDSLWDAGFFDGMVESLEKRRRGPSFTKESFYQHISKVGPEVSVALAESINTIKEQTAPPEDNDERRALVGLIAKDLTDLNISNLRYIQSVVRSRVTHQRQGAEKTKEE